MKVIVGLVSNVSVFLQAAVDEGLLDFVELSGIVFLWSNLRLVFHDLGVCLLEGRLGARYQMQAF